jgi:hypothetical protein
MNHPTTVWYLAQAKLDDLERELERPHLPRAPRPRLRERVAAHLPHRQRTAQAAPVGCAGLPMGCAA